MHDWVSYVSRYVYASWFSVSYVIPFAFSFSSSRRLTCRGQKSISLSSCNTFYVSEVQTFAYLSSSGYCCLLALCLSFLSWYPPFRFWLCFILNGYTISWHAKKQQSVASSTTEAEYMALATTSWQAVWYLNACKQVGYTIPITIMADNSFRINVAENPINNPWTKHIDVAYHFTREQLIRKCLMLAYAPSNDNPADLIITGLNSVAHYVRTQCLELSEWERALRHTFCRLCWVNTIDLISLISFVFLYTTCTLL